MRLNISSIMSHAHLHALPVSLDIPGAFSCAAMKIASLTSLLVMLWYAMSLGCSFRLGVGSFSRWGGSGNKCVLSVSHFCTWVTAGGWFSS